MEMKFDHPEVLNDFESASPRRVRGWVWFGLGLWLLLLVGDWAARVSVFRWQDQWLPHPVPMAQPAETARTATAWQIPAQTGAGLTKMVPVPWIAARYAEFHPAYTEHQDAQGYCNGPLPEGKSYSVVMLGDSFMLSLGTQNVAQALASVGGIDVYNHASLGAGPFREMRKFIESGHFNPAPQVIIWNLTARELGGHMFLKQAVDGWFGGWQDPYVNEIATAASRVQWNLLAPSALRKSWPNTSLAAYFSRRGWAQLRLMVFRAWPKEVLGADDPQFGPMLFYRENLRMLPMPTPETDAPGVVKTVMRISAGFRARGMTLVVLLVPEKEQIYARALPLADQKALARGPELLSAIEAGLKDGGVPVVNLMPVFQKATAQGIQVYWRDDTHWNDAGIRLAAEELWRVTEPLLK
jgi:hypothetical protein